MPNPFNKEGKVISIPADELLELMEKGEVKAMKEEKTISKEKKEEKNIERNPREYPVTVNFHEKSEWLEKEFDWQTKNLTQKIKKEYPKEANSIIQELLKAAIVNGRFGEEIISKIVLKILTILLRKL